MDLGNKFKKQVSSARKVIKIYQNLPNQIILNYFSDERENVLKLYIDYAELMSKTKKSFKTRKNNKDINIKLNSLKITTSSTWTSKSRRYIRKFI